MVAPLALYPYYRGPGHRVYRFANGNLRVFRETDGQSVFLRGGVAHELGAALDRLGYCDETAELLAGLAFTPEPTGQGDLFDYR